MTKHWWPLTGFLQENVISPKVKVLHLYDYCNDFMSLVIILVIKYITGDDDLE